MREPLVVDGRNFLDREALVRRGLHLRGHRAQVGAGAVLAGGEGTRLRPLTYTDPEAGDAAGRAARSSSFMLDWLRGHGVDEVILSCGFLSDGVKRVLGDIYDGHAAALRGRGGAARHRRPGAARATTRACSRSACSCSNGDVLTDIDLTAELAQHEQRRRTGHARAVRGRRHRAATASCPPTTTAAWRQFLEKRRGRGAHEPHQRRRLRARARAWSKRIPRGPRRVVRARGLPGARRATGLLRLRTPRATGSTSGRPSATSRRPGTCSPGASSRSCPRATRPARWSTSGCLRGGRARRAAERARAPLLGGHRLARRALGAARPRDRGRRRLGRRERARRARARGRRARGSSPGAMVGAGAAIGDGAVVGEGARLDPASRSTPGARGARAARGAGAGELTSRRATAIEAGRPGGMLGDVLAQPHAARRRALARASPPGIPQRDLPGRAGGVRHGRLGDRRRPRGGRARRPRHPPDHAPSAATRSSPGPARTALVLCASYSGDTEETLACFEAAGAAGARARGADHRRQAGRRGARGGRAGDRRALRDAAARRRGLHDGRGARVRGACGAAPRLRSEIDAAAGAARRAREEWGPDAPADAARRRSPGARTARCRWCTAPGRRPPSPAAGRPRSTRTPRCAAFASELPEADHNEICGWERGAATGAVRGRVPRGPGPASARARPHRADRRRGGAGRRAGLRVERARRDAAWSGCSRWCCWATCERLPRARWPASIQRRWSRSTGSGRTRLAAPAPANLDTLVVRLSARWRG